MSSDKEDEESDEKKLKLEVYDADATRQPSNGCLSGQVLGEWNRRKKSIICNLSTNGWLLSVDTDTRGNLQHILTGP